MSNETNNQARELSEKELEGVVGGMDSIQAIQARLDPYIGALQPGALDRFSDQLGGAAQPCVIMPDPPTPMSVQSARREEIVLDIPQDLVAN